jgi:DNA-binding SARP family transcriptional activator
LAYPFVERGMPEALASDTVGPAGVTTRIRLCGELSVEVEGRRVDGVPPGGVAHRLLAHLLAHHDRPIERSELRGLVGDDAALERGLEELRPLWGDRLEVDEGGVTLRLPADAWVDVEAAQDAAGAAEAALGAGQPGQAIETARSALALLERPYLPELAGDCVERRRQELEDLRSGLLARLARAALALDPPDTAAAAAAARELIERQPYRESAYVLLMDAHARRGEVDEALGAYERLRRRLEDELGVEPGPVARRLRDRLRGQLAPAPDLPQAAPLPVPAMLARVEQRPFVGRGEALRALRRRWRRALEGDGGMLLVAGEPGIGKTRLAARFAAEVHGEGAAVLYGRTDEESVVPYQPFVEALRDYAAHAPGLAADPEIAPVVDELAALVPELGGTPPQPRAPASELRARRYRLFDAVARVLRHAGGERPLLLVLEDLHWADTATLLLLREVVRQGAGTRLLVLGAYQEPEVDPSHALARLMAQLRREDALERIELGGLDEAETAALVATRGTAEPAERTRRLRKQTAGNPYFIEQLLRSAAEATGAEPGVPEGVKEVIGRRLERLPLDAVDVLMTAAYLGSDIRLETLHAVAGDVDVVEAIEAAVAAGLVVEYPDEIDHFCFAHALVRQTLYERPVLSRRLRLHLVVGEALEQAPLEVHPGELAHHFFLARQVGGAEKAIVYSLEAAEAASEAHAPEEAAEHYRHALAALEIARPTDVAARLDVLLALGAARWQASEPDPAATFLEAAALAREIGSPARLANAALGAGGRFYAPGPVDPAYVALLEEALGALDPGDSSLCARLLVRLAERLALAEPVARAEALAREAVSMARRIGELSALATALMGLHAALLHVRHAAERRRIGEEVLALAGELEADELGALGRHWLIYDLFELGDLEAARERLAALEAVADELRQPLYRHSALSWRAVWAGLGGRFAEAERLARESLRLAQRADAPDRAHHFALQLVALRREQGRLGELREEIERYRARADPGAVVWRALAPLACLDAGDAEGARAAYERARAEEVAETLFWLSAKASLAEAAAMLDDADGAAALYPQLEPHAERLVQTSFTGCAGSVHRLLGRLAATGGRPQAARAHFEAALARHAALGAPALLARTQCDYAELLASGSGAERERAGELLRAAGTMAGRLGLAGIAARVQAAARSGAAR